MFLSFSPLFSLSKINKKSYPQVRTKKIKSSPSPSTDVVPLNHGYFPESTECQGLGAWTRDGGGEVELRSSDRRLFLPAPAVGGRGGLAGPWGWVGQSGTPGLRSIEALDGNDLHFLAALFITLEAVGDFPRRVPPSLF